MSRKFKLVFLYPGFGSQWKRMGAGLMEYDVFRAAIRECAKEFNRYEDWHIEEEMQKPLEISRLEDPAVGYPCSMAVEIALMELLKAWGIIPAAVIGHSGGEVAAAYNAGILSLKDAFRVIWSHSVLMNKEKNGAMAHISLPPDRVKQILKNSQGLQLENRVFISGHNSPKAVIVSGEKQAIKNLVDWLTKEKVFCRMLNIATAFHSPFIRRYEKEFYNKIKGIRTGKALMPIYSCLHGGLSKETDYTSSYWTRHMIHSVNFVNGIRAMINHGYRMFIEISPHPILLQNIKEILEESGVENSLVVGTLKRDEDDKQELFNCLARLSLVGFPVPQEGLAPGEKQRLQLSMAALAGNAPASQAPPAQQEEIILQLVQQSIREVLPQEEIPLEDVYLGFFQMGFDSMTAVKLSESLSRQLGISLPATLIFDYPDIHALVRYLVSVTGNKPAAINRDKKVMGIDMFNEPIAVIGMACRFPGGGNSLESFWDLLKNGKDTVTRIPQERWDADAFYSAEIIPGKSITKQGNFISGIDIATFDAGFFRISPKEARSLDPQHRLLLEVTVEALENAAIPILSIRGKAVGVFIGMAMDDYKKAHLFSEDLGNIDPYSGTGAMFSPASGRISYFLGIRGPSMVVDTACSSSLTALHSAVQALRSRECEMALAGGVNLLLFPNMFVYLTQLNTLAADGTCKTFDEKADGFGRGEGCGIVVLKPLSAALDHKDNILAVIKGTAVNHDGASTGFTAPHGIAQQEVISRALAAAGVPAESVDYIETHGAGTPLGDPIEIGAIAEIYGKNRTRERPVLLGSVKTNIGHLEGAAGAAGLIKAVLSLQHQTIPAHLHVSRPNPLIPWEHMPVKIATGLTPWQKNQPPRRAGLSGFGFSGTNAHVILEESPIGHGARSTEHGAREEQGREARPYQVMLLSAKTQNALKEQVELYEKFLTQSSLAAFADICYTAAVGRSHFEYRFSALGETPDRVKKKMATFLDNPAKGLYTNIHKKELNPRIVFLFTGQGSQYVGMAKELYETEPLFKARLDKCDGLFYDYIQSSLVELLYSPRSGGEKLNEALYAQPVIFSVEHALSELWRSWGVEPSLVMGHSIGEYAAACTAGVLTLEDAVRLVAIRGQIMQSAREQGQMVGILTNEENAQIFIKPYNDVSIAAVNAPENVTISGRKTSVEKVIEKIKQAKIFIEPLNISHAFHSVLMEPYVEKFRKEIAGVKFSLPVLPMVSTILGRRVGEEICDPGYWARHFCRTVRYSDSLQLAWDQGYRIYIEIGGTATLAGLASQCIPDTPEESNHALFLPSLRKGKHACEQLFTSLSQLYLQGFAIDWEQFYRYFPGKKVLLPTYPFQRERYWHEGLSNRQVQEAPIAAKAADAGAVAGIPQTHDIPASMIEIKAGLKDMISSLSGMNPEDIPGHVDLFSLGLDSLMLTELRRKIIGSYGIDITLNDFFMELTTLDKIAGYIDMKVPSMEKQEPEFPSVPSVSSVAKVSPGTKPLNFSVQASPVQRSLTPQQQRHLDALIARYTQRTKTSKQQAQVYRQVLADSKATVGFNFSSKELLYPIVGKTAKGSRIRDIDDNEYIDVTMGFGVYLLGHHPAVVTRALRELGIGSPALGPRSYLVGEVAELVSRLTGMDRVTFTNTGTEAVMAAIRLARAATGRSKIVMFSRSYHGHSDGTLAVSYNRDDKIYSEPVSPGIPRESIRNVLVLDYLEPRSLEVIEAHADQLAAVLVEPVQARDPGRQPREFLHELRKITQRSGIVLIFDEMITGFRLHLGGAQAYFNVEADICTYGKIIGGGLPIGVIAGKARYLDHIDGGFWQYGDDSYPQVERTFFGGTFCQYHEAMVAARAVLKYLEKQGPQLQNQLNQRTETFAQTLNNYLKEKEIALRLNYFSSIFRFEIPGNLDLFYYHMLEKGIYIWEWRNCFLSTAHTDQDLEDVIAAVKESIEEMAAGGFPVHRTKRAAPARIFPMSSVQKRLYVLSQTAAGQQAYYLPVALRVNGPLDVKKVETAFKELIKRHEILRTGLEIKDQQLVQRIYDYEEVEFSIIYKKSTGDPRDTGEIQQLVEEVFEPFDLSRPPLMRVSITEFSPHHFIFISNYHHNIMDGSSYAVLVQDFMRLYRGEGFPPVKVQYKEYVEWEQQYIGSPEFRAHEEFWTKQLAGELPVLELPTDYPYPEVLDFAGKTLHLKIGKEKTRRLKKLAPQTSVSLNMLLLGLFNVLLYKLTNQEDIIVGIPAIVREHGDFQHTIGMFTNTLVLRSYPTANKSFTQFLQEVKHHFLQVYTHQEYPYEELVARLGSLGNTRHNPIFSAAISYEHGDPHVYKIPGLTFTNIDINQGASPFDLFVWIIEEEEELNIGLNYRTSLFKEETAARWGQYFEKLIDEVLQDPNTLLSALDMCSEAEKQEILWEFNDTFSDFPRDKTIPQLFAEQAERNPDHTALVGIHEIHEIHKKNGNRSYMSHMSYKELSEKSSRLVEILRSKGVGPDAIVGLLAERSIEMIVAILGILKAGGAYLPIEVGYPEERINYMLEDSKARILLAAPETQAKVKAKAEEGRVHPQGLPLQIINIDKDIFNFFKSASSTSTLTSTCEVGPANLAYVIYTSGTTGKPKGNLTTHTNVIRVVRNSNYIDITGRDRILQLSNYAFDGSVFDIYGALLNGAVLVMVTGDQVLSVNKLAEKIEKDAITVFFVTTALFNVLVEEKIHCLRHVRKVLFGGERVSVDHSRKALAYLGKDRVIHVYGPTETTVYATYYNINHISANPLTIPIGRPISNTVVYILDRALNPVPLLVYGEIYIGGDGVCRGYLNRPELTAEKFIYLSNRSYMSYKTHISKKIYKSGDLGRWLPGRSIEFLGRIDQQIKIRGFRVELGEIESRLLERDDIKEAVVVSRRDDSGDQYLCAYIVAEKEKMPEPNKLREYLASILPDYMIPAFFVPLEKIPLTANGKLDRRALPEPVLGRAKESLYTPPRNDMERKLVSLWSKALKIKGEVIGIDDNFFHLGGHSLKGALLAAGIEKEFDIKFPLTALFQAPSIRAAADFIRQGRRQVLEDIEPVEEKEYYPLSSAQRRLFFLDQFENIGTSYNIPEIIKVEGKLDKERFEEVFPLLIQRHESLRTSFHMVDAVPVQEIHEDFDFEIQYYGTDSRETDNYTGNDLRLWTMDAGSTGSSSLALSLMPYANTIKSFIRPFDLSKAPLLRVGLIQLAEEEHILMVDMHHIISDGTSLGIFIKEFTELLKDRDLPGLSLRYRDYSHWQNRESQKESIKKQEKYWLNRFADEVPVLELPVDYPRPEFQDFTGQIISFEISEEETAALRRLANNENATLYMVLLASFTVLLAKITGNEDISVGTPMASRRHIDLQPIIGMFVSTLVMRNYPAPSKTAVQFIQEVKENTLAAFENQDYPFENLVEKVVENRDTGRNPLFDVMFALQNIDLPGFEMEGLKLEPYNYDSGVSIIDLFLQGFETGDILIFSLNYCTKLFKEETIKQLITYYKKILYFLIESPGNAGRTISEIEIISPQEKERILYDFNRTASAYPRDKTIHRLFQEQAEKVPDQIALVGIHETHEKHKKNYNMSHLSYMSYMSYKELNEKSSQLATVLIEKGVQPDTIVGLMLERSIEMIIAVLGILKAGGAYLPINPGYPEERINFMLGDSGAKILVNQEFLKHSALSNSPLERGTPKGGGVFNLAYIIYTSGSTGQPKGVMVQHRNVVRLVKNTNYLRFHEYHCILQTGVLEFDASTFEIWGALLNRGQLVLAAKEDVITPSILEHILWQNHITTMWMTAPLFNQLVGEDTRLFGYLRYLLVGGDVLSPLHINRVRQEFPGLTIINGYGPTENTTFSTTFLIDKEYTRQIPIGKPIANSTAYIVDKNNHLLPVGIAGELILGGDGVSRGYMNNPELTNEKFCLIFYRSNRSYMSYISKKIYKTGDLARWLPDGNIEFLGRMDQQVKIRGFRIEIEEIESRLLAHPDVKTAVVTALGMPGEDKILAAYVVTTAPLPGIDEIKTYLTKKLPDFMIPSYIIPLEKLPLTANGKVDRKALPQPGIVDTRDHAYTPPSHQVEKILVSFWAEILGIKKEMIGIDANFFKLGGHSLRAVRLITRIHKAFNTRIPLQVFFKMPSIRSLSGYIRGAVKEVYISALPIEKKEYYPLSSIQKRLFLFDRVGDVKTAYNLCRAVIITGEPGVNRDRFQQTFQLLIRRHESLRTSFAIIDNEAVQIVHDTVDFSLDFCEAKESEIDDLISGFIIPFELGTAPLLRAKLVKLSARKYVFLYDIHHIIADGTSLGIFLAEFMEMYRGEELPGLSIQYKDFCQWQHNNRETHNPLLQQKENYWLERFKGKIPKLEIYTDYPRPQVQSFAGSQLKFRFEKELIQQIHELMKETDTTLYMVLLAFYTILLARYTGQEDIIVGTPAAGREQVDVENVMGLFMNPLPMRNYPQGNKTFREFLEEVKQTTIEAYENQGYPFGDLVEKLALSEDLSRNPIFEAELLVQNMEIPEWKIEGLKFTQYEFAYPSTQIDIALECVEANGRIFFNLTYSTALFKRATMEGFVDSFREIAATVLDYPCTKLEDIKVSHYLLSTQANIYQETQVDFEF